MVLVVAVVLALLWGGEALATGSEAFNVTGGDATQRTTIVQAFDASTWDWSNYSREYPRTPMRIVASMPPTRVFMVIWV